MILHDPRKLKGLDLLGVMNARRGVQRVQVHRMQGARMLVWVVRVIIRCGGEIIPGLSPWHIAILVARSAVRLFNSHKSMTSTLGDGMVDSHNAELLGQAGST